MNEVSGVGGEMSGIVHKKVTEYIEDFGGIQELQDLELYAKENYVPIVMKDAARFLGFMIAANKPQAILELGTAIGYSALVMAMYGDGQITSVERDEAMQNIALDNIKKKGYENRIHVVLDDCAAFLKKSDQVYDFIFMDAGKSHYREYLDLSLPRLSQEGMILCDNVLYKGLVAEEEVARKHRTNIVNLKDFIRYVHEREDLVVSLLSISDGMLLIRRKNKNV